ncbi:MAG: hypothetical protein ACTHNW_00030 [Mucilaginibacter sp.]
MLSRNSKEKTRFSKLTREICQREGIDESVLLYLVNNELARLAQLGHENSLKLEGLEAELQQKQLSVEKLKALFAEKVSAIDAVTGKIAGLSTGIAQNEERLKSLSATLAQLQVKKDSLAEEVKKEERNHKQLEYDILIKRHDVQSNSWSGRKISIMLFIFSIIGIIIAILLITHKRK